MVPEDFYEKITELSARDSFVCGLLRRLQELEPGAREILEGLGERERETILEYESICLEIEYQKTRLAAAHYALSGAKVFVP